MTRRALTLALVAQEGGDDESNFGDSDDEEDWDLRDVSSDVGMDPDGLESDARCASYLLYRTVA